MRLYFCQHAHFTSCKHAHFGNRAKVTYLVQIPICNVTGNEKLFKQPNDKASLLTINFGNLAKQEFTKLLISLPQMVKLFSIPPIDTQDYIRVIAAKKHK